MSTLNSQERITRTGTVVQLPCPKSRQGENGPGVVAHADGSVLPKKMSTGINQNGSRRKQIVRAVPPGGRVWAAREEMSMVWYGAMRAPMYAREPQASRRHAQVVAAAGRRATRVAAVVGGAACARCGEEMPVADAEPPQNAGAVAASRRSCRTFADVATRFTRAAPLGVYRASEMR